MPCIIPTGDVSRKAVGYKEGSGFIHAHNQEPITFHPDYAYKGEMPVSLTTIAEMLSR